MVVSAVLRGPPFLRVDKMKTNVNLSDFRDAFQSHDRKNFSYAGLEALYNWLIDIEEDSGEEWELDVIALCCEYSEHETALDCAREYGYEEVVDLEPHGSVDLLEVAELEEAQAAEWLNDRTTVIAFDGGIILQQF